eukprot:4172078-Prorocentrum_lima.AAC.1
MPIPPPGLYTSYRHASCNWDLMHENPFNALLLGNNGRTTWRDHGIGTVNQRDWWLLEHRDRKLPTEPGFGSKVSLNRKWACPGCGE